MRLFKKGQEITPDLMILRKCSKYRCKSKIMSKITYNEENSNRYGLIFCSPQCNQDHMNQLGAYQLSP